MAMQLSAPAAMRVPQPQFSPARNQLGALGSGARSMPELKSKSELKNQIQHLVKSSVKDRTGPSFDARLALAVAQKTHTMKLQEREQWSRIRECKERGLAKSTSASPLQAMTASGETPQKIMMERNIKLEQRQKQLGVQTKEYFKQRRLMLEKIRTREPLFRLSEVGKAQENLNAQAEKRRNELRAEEKKRWEMLEEINRSVLNRPLLMDL